MADPFSRPVFARARRLCLSLPEVTEKLAWGHPSFRVSGRTFCTFEMIKGRPSIAFRLPSETCEHVVTEASGFVTPYGRGSWASLWVDGAVNGREIADLLRLAYRTVAARRMIALLDAPAVAGRRRKPPTVRRSRDA